MPEKITPTFTPTDILDLGSFGISGDPFQLRARGARYLLVHRYEPQEMISENTLNTSISRMGYKEGSPVMAPEPPYQRRSMRLALSKSGLRRSFHTLMPTKFGLHTIMQNTSSRDVG